MNRNWVYFDPADRSTAAMLEFILKSCQEVRILANRYRPPISEETQAAIVAGYLKNHPEAKPVPRYTLLQATKWPSSSITSFILPPRDGWSNTEEKVKAGPTWEQYNRGETVVKKFDGRAVEAMTAYNEFVFNHKLHFMWGTLVMQTGYIADLKRQVGDFNGTFLSDVKWMEVRVVKTRDGKRKWKIHFSIE